MQPGNGIIIGKVNSPTSSVATGVWKFNEIQRALLGNNWPLTQVTNGDSYWQYTTLLSGTGSTNGAQNNTFLDSSSNNFTITRNGNTTQGTFSPFSLPNGYWGNYFDGSGDYLSVADNTAFDLGSGAFTLEAWIFSPDVTPSKAEWIISQWQSDTGNSWGFRIETDGSLNFYYSSDGNNAALVGTSTPGLSANVWHHIAVVRNSNTVTIYVDGVSKASGTVSATFYNSSASVMVGNQAATGLGQTFTGYISNARVVKGTAVYTSAFTPPTSPLTAISGTSLLTCQSNRFADNSSNSFTVTANGNVAVLPFAPFGNTSMYSTTSVGGSGYFDGTGDYLSVANNAALQFGTGDFAVEFWIYQTSLTSYQTPYSLGYVSGGDFLIQTGNGNGLFRVFIGGSEIVAETGTGVANAWNHIVVSRVGTTLRIFRNGSQTGSATDSSNINSTSTLTIGSGSTYPLFGYMSGLRVLKGTGYTSVTVPTSPPTNIANTQLLLNYTNAGIYDQAAGNDFETVGNAQVSTSVVKYGSGSMYFDGTGDWLALPGSRNAMIGTGEYTVEGWIYKDSSATGERGIISSFDASTYGFGIWSDSTTLYFEERQSAYDGSNPRITVGFTTTNTWVHVAMSRQGGVLKAFVNGSQVGSTSTNLRTLSSAAVLYIGRNLAATNPWLGYLSEFRVTVGLGRYPYNFTPPTQAFANFYSAPVTPTADPYFDYTTLLLPGSGTNGAQNNTFLDSSTNAFSITRNGNTTQGTFSPFSQTGWSNLFAGNSAYTFASNSAFNLDTYSTIEFWVYFNSLTSDVLLAGRQNAYWVSFNYASFSGTNKFAFSLTADNGSSWTNVVSTTTPTVGQWYHVAAVRDNTTLRLYINGSQEATASFASTPSTPANPFRVGGFDSSTGSVNGYLSNVRYTKGSTSGALPYTANFTPSTTPLTAITGTQILTAQSNRFVDNSTNAFAITLSGSPSVQAFSPFAPTAAYSAATNGGSGYFDGTGDNLALPSSSNLAFGTGDFCVEAWVYWTSTGVLDAIFSNLTSSGAGDTQFNLQITTGNKIQITAWSTTFLTGSTSLTSNAWNHVVVCRSGTTLSIFLNGSRDATTTSSNNWSSTNAFYIGDYPVGGAAFSGYISNLRAIKGSTPYDATASTLTVPTTALTAITNTSLLCNFTNAGITDATAKNDLETVGNAQISNGQAKWGSTSMYFDGTGDYLVTPSKAITTLEADFTIEWWNYRNTTGNNYMFTVGDSSTSTGIEIYIGSSGAQLNVYSNNGIVINAGTPPTYNTWSHYALVRYGGVVRLYVNGVQVSSTWSSTASFSGAVYVGAEFYSGSVTGSANGYFNDFRITKGIARYTQSFTPPTAAFQLL